MASRVGLCAAAVAAAGLGVRAQDMVTCRFTIDNNANKVYVDGVDLTPSTTCQTSWQTPCEITFVDQSDVGQHLAIYGDEQTHDGEENPSLHIADGGFCGTNGAGMYFACESTLASSPWNGLVSTTASGVWRSASLTTEQYAALADPLGPQDADGRYWFDPAFDEAKWDFPGAAGAPDSVWGDPEVSASGFNCQDCLDFNPTAQPIWAAGCNDHGFFLLTGCLDQDNDSVCDADDNCPSDVNAEQADLDSDGIGDQCDDCQDVDADGVCDPDDNCPSDANENQADLDSDGTGDVCDDCQDVDDDGICDDVDNCLGISNADQADLDIDGVGDACDNCPSTPGADQTDGDDDGFGVTCDCDDADDAVNPDAPEVCDDLVDNDCDSFVDNAECGTDCDGDWGAWSECSRTCGAGVRLRTYCVFAQASGDGEACPACDGATSSSSCNLGACAADKDDDDDKDDEDDRNDDKDFPFAPYVDVDESGAFTIFGHYRNTNHTYNIASVDLMVRELGGDGAPLSSHAVSSFEDQEYSVRVNEDGSFSCVPAAHVKFGAALEDDGGHFGTVVFNTWVFSQNGNVTSPSGAEMWAVGPGDTKFSVDVEHWAFCDGDNGGPCAAGKEGSELELTIVITHGTANPKKGDYVNRARRRRLAAAGGLVEEDLRGCGQGKAKGGRRLLEEEVRAGADGSLRQRLRAMHALAADATPKRAVVRRALKDKDDDDDTDDGEKEEEQEEQEDPALSTSNDGADDKEDDKDDDKGDDEDSSASDTGEDDDDDKDDDKGGDGGGGSGGDDDDDDDDDDDRDDDDDNCYVVDDFVQLVLSTEVNVDGEYQAVSPTTTSGAQSTTIVLRIPKFTGGAGYDPIVVAYQVDEDVAVSAQSAPSTDGATTDGASNAGGVVAGVITALVVVGAVVGVVVFAHRRRSMRRRSEVLEATRSATTSGHFQTVAFDADAQGGPAEYQTL